MRVVVSVQNLAADVTEDRVKAYFEERLPGCEPRVFPLVEYPQHEFYGTIVKFSILKGSDEARALARLRDRRRDLFEIELPHVTINNDFNSVTILSQSSHDSQFDVFFIHGLNGHAYNTFASSSVSSDDFLWARDLLPKDMSQRSQHGRYLTFGYDASWMPGGGAWSKSLKENASNLLLAMEFSRAKGSTTPIFLVCHSMGGLVACQAILATMTRVEGMGGDFKKTFAPNGSSLFKGVAFFGTPFKGSVLANVIGPVQSILGKRDAAFARLRQKDKITKSMLRAFGEFRMKEPSPLPLLPFYEEKPLFSRLFVTPRDSARGYFDDVDCLPVRRDHRQMCKFDHAGDDELVQIIPRIRRLISNGVSNAPTHFHGADQLYPTNKKLPPIEAQLSGGLNCRGKEHEQSLIKLSDSAAIFQRFAARHRINPSRTGLEYARSPVQDTCNWISSKPQFKMWADAPNDTVLLIRGASGTGKTVLSRFIVEFLGSTYKHRSTTIITIIYCKNKDGVASPLTIMRHLLHSIGKQNPEIFIQTYEEHVLFAQDDGSFRFLWEFFILFRTKISNEIFYVIDGLDECIQDTQIASSNTASDDIVDFLKRLIHPTAHDSGQTSMILRILFTTQPMKEVFKATGVNRDILLDLKMEDLTPGVTHMIEQDVAQFVSANQLSKEIETLIVSNLKEKSDSNYQYAVAAFKTLTSSKAIETGSLDGFQKTLDELVPLDINKTYEKTLIRIQKDCLRNEEKLIMISAMLKLLVYTASPLSVDDLQHALILWIFGRETDKFYSRLPFGLASLIESQYGALMQIEEDRQLDTKRWPDFSCADSVAINARIASICLDRLCTIDTLMGHDAYRNFMQIQGWTERRQLPLFIHAAAYWDTYVTRAGAKQYSIWSKVANLFESEAYNAMRLAHCERWNDEELAADHVPYTVFLGYTGMISMIEDWSNVSFSQELKRMIRNTLRWRPKYHRLPIEVSAKSSPGQFTALHAASYVGDINLVQHLLSIGAPGHCRAEDGSTAFSIAVRRRHDHIIKLLLDTGNAFQEAERLLENDFSTIQYTALHGMTHLLRQLLRQGWKPDGAAHMDISPIIVACHFNQLDVVQLLVEYGALQKDCELGYCELHVAALSGYLPWVQALFKTNHGIDPAPLDRYGYTPMILAARHGHQRVVEFFMSILGADACGTDGSTPLHQAAEGGHLETVKLLFTSVTGNAANKYHELPLHLAANANHSEIVRFFLEQGVDVNAKRHHSSAGQTCLQIAIIRDYEELYEFLFAFDGVEVHTKDADGQTLLHYAALTGNHELLHQLLRRGLNPTATDAGNMTALHHAAMSKNVDAVHVILQALKDKGLLDINILAKSLVTPIMFAAASGSVEVFKVLEREGGRLEQKDREGYNAFLLASVSQSTTILEHLLEKDINFGVTDHVFNGNALHHASQNGCVEHLRLLLQKGSSWLERYGLSINSFTSDNRTPLIAACYSTQNRYEVVELLLKHGANPTERSFIGKSALDYLQSDSRFDNLLKEKWTSYRKLNVSCHRRKLRDCASVVLHDQAWKLTKQISRGDYISILGSIWVQDEQWAQYAKALPYRRLAHGSHVAADCFFRGSLNQKRTVAQGYCIDRHALRIIHKGYLFNWVTTPLSVSITPVWLVNRTLLRCPLKALAAHRSPRCPRLVLTITTASDLGPSHLAHQRCHPRQSRALPRPPLHHPNLTTALDTRSASPFPPHHSAKFCGQASKV
ncbi:hypothetical protein FH972_025986 [Carpinus fangiana]|uniref:Nephrocystin 3-like N-terminal domain-containing protein n=1 Tax=Carpinus fangiana TaxID=176857 RepID=A0A5N6L2P9_9ROSI|nr:hypothetical protein FH972_025986 [Carpinus fangiana]